MLLGEKESSGIRELYIDTFLDVNSKYYQERILKTVDSIFHAGYFWDIFKNPKIIKKSKILHQINCLQNDIYVIWDNNIYNRGIKYPIFAVLQVSPKDFESLLPELPEDIYIFDDTFTWTYALTHEEIDGKDYCLECNK